MSRSIETSISISNIQEAVIQFLNSNGFVHKDEDVIDFKFGKGMSATPKTKINDYLKLTIPITYTVKKKEEETKIFRYARKT